MSSATKPFAVFDIDGTVSRHSLTVEVSQEMCRRQLIPGVDYGSVEAAEASWRHSRNNDDYLTYLALTVGTLYDNLAQLEVAVYDRVLEDVLERLGRQVYFYPLQLIKDLRQQGYYILALSGSEHQSVARFCSRYDFDDCLGSDFERRDGRFTGKIDFTVFAKGDYLQQLIDKHGLDLAGSVAVGDTEIDIPMLELVERPICFNPTPELWQTAKERSWPIVLERKGVIYELEPEDGGYRLKSA